MYKIFEIRELRLSVYICDEDFYLNVRRIVFRIFLDMYSDLGESLLNVVDQVDLGLDSDGESDEVVLNSKKLSVLSWD